MCSYSCMYCYSMSINVLKWTNNIHCKGLFLKLTIIYSYFSYSCCCISRFYSQSEYLQSPFYRVEARKLFALLYTQP